MPNSSALIKQFRQILKLIRRNNHNYNSINHTHGQGHVLTLLSRQDGLTLSEISMALDIRPSSAGELVRKLENQELVERRRNKNDRRVTNVFLTQKGRENLSQKIKNSNFKHIFAPLDQNEQEQLLQLINKIIEPLEKDVNNIDENCSLHRRCHRNRKMYNEQ